MSAATVVCVLRSGGVYTPRYVAALRAGLLEHAPDTRLVCLTDIPDQVQDYVDETHTLIHRWPKWWCLVEWFGGGYATGNVIAVGLDTLIVGPLDDLARYPGTLAMISDFYQPAVLASGTMLWRGDACQPIFKEFLREGPDRVINSHLRMDYWLRKAVRRLGYQPDVIQTLYPRQVVSFKAHARKGIPEGARIVCGHGRPQFSDISAGWAHRLWSERAHGA